MSSQAIGPLNEVDLRPGGVEVPASPWYSRAAAALALPREHGAWAMLLMPYLVGTAAAGWGGWSSWLLLVSTLLLFSSSRSLELVLQNPLGARRTAGKPAIPDPPLEREIFQRRLRAIARLEIYWGLAAVAGILLLLVYERWALLAMAALSAAALGAQFALRRRRLDRTWPARLISVAGLSMAGPAAYYTASGAIDRHALAVGLLAFVYSGASVFYVRLFYRPPAKQKPAGGLEGRIQAERQLLAYLVATATLLAGLAATGWMPLSGLLALAPLAAKSGFAISRRHHRPTLKRIGKAEILHTSLFALLAAAAVATWK